VSASSSASTASSFSSSGNFYTGASSKSSNNNANTTDSYDKSSSAKFYSPQPQSNVLSYSANHHHQQQQQQHQRHQYQLPLPTPSQPAPAPLAYNHQAFQQYQQYNQQQQLYFHQQQQYQGYPNGALPQMNIAPGQNHMFNANLPYNTSNYQPFMQAIPPLTPQQQQQQQHTYAIMDPQQMYALTNGLGNMTLATSASAITTTPSTTNTNSNQISSDPQQFTSYLPPDSYPPTNTASQSNHQLIQQPQQQIIYNLVPYMPNDPNMQQYMYMYVAPPPQPALPPSLYQPPPPPPPPVQYLSNPAHPQNSVNLPGKQQQQQHQQQHQQSYGYHQVQPQPQGYNQPYHNQPYECPSQPPPPSSNISTPLYYRQQKKTCFTCGSLQHLASDCSESQTANNNAQRGSLTRQGSLCNENSSAVNVNVNGEDLLQNK
jgi:hypothetical protein